MTRLADRKTRLTFETDATVRYRGRQREIIVEVPDSYNLAVRLKGTRQRLLCSWEALYFLAAKLEANRVREEKKRKRLGRAA